VISDGGYEGQSIWHTQWRKGFWLGNSKDGDPLEDCAPVIILKCILNRNGADRICLVVDGQVVAFLPTW
jgi:hypothetical protein